ncbi:MAG: hypothetical protein ACREN4_04755 [Candidatus Dormibacteria bacterium]
MAFKRASLTGSAQLFQPTRVPTRDRPSDQEPQPPELREVAAGPIEEILPRPEPLHIAPLPTTPQNQGHIYRLSDEEVEVLLAALQHAKFPHSYQRLPKPALEEFEELEALRQKITDQRGPRG